MVILLTVEESTMSTGYYGALSSIYHILCLSLSFILYFCLSVCLYICHSHCFYSLSICTYIFLPFLHLFKIVRMHCTNTRINMHILKEFIHICSLLLSQSANTKRGTESVFRNIILVEFQECV